MTSLVQSSPGHRFSGNASALKTHLGADIKFAQRIIVPVLGAIPHTREQWFRVLDIDATRPRELKGMESIGSEFHYLNKQSAIHLPATPESLRLIQRGFQEHAMECSYGCTLGVLDICYCAGDNNFIRYSMKTRITSHRH